MALLETFKDCHQWPMAPCDSMGWTENLQGIIVFFAESKVFLYKFPKPPQLRDIKQVSLGFRDYTNYKIGRSGHPAEGPQASVSLVLSQWWVLRCPSILVRAKTSLISATRFGLEDVRTWLFHVLPYFIRWKWLFSVSAFSVPWKSRDRRSQQPGECPDWAKEPSPAPRTEPDVRPLWVYPRQFYDATLHGLQWLWYILCVYINIYIYYNII